MRFSDGFLDEIRDRVPISAVVGQRVTWDRKKTNAPRGDYWACCPFHGEKSPSFHCEDRKGRYHCFGCGVSGDHFRFLTELDGLSFPEAVERIAEMAGVPMPARDAQEERRERERATLHDVMEMATQFFQERLQAADGAKARAYLRDRGLTPATQQSFRLGYAPDSRNALKEYLGRQGRRRRSRSRPAGWSVWRGHAGVLRPVPRPHHVPDPGFARPHHRLWRPGDVAGRFRPNT